MRTFIAAAAALWTFPALASGLVGTIVPPYPGAMSSDMGSCIAADDDICAYSIATLNAPDGAVTAVLARKGVGHVDGQAVWEIVDTHEAPDQADGQSWAVEECRIDDVIAPAVIGLVTFKDMGGWIEAEETVWAVQFDIASGRLVQLDPAHVRCVLPGS